MKKRPNVILIAIDTLRADHLGCYGYQRATSPRIDDFASQSVVFEKLIAADIPTHPSFTSVFTGCGSYAHGVTHVAGKVDPPENYTMLSEALKAGGYKTYAADNLKRWMKRGFDKYEDYSWENVQNQMRKAEAVNKTAIPMLKEAASGDDPFFMFVHYWDPHTPYLPPKPYDRMFYDKPAGAESDPNNTSLHKVFAFPPFASYFNDWMGGITDADYAVAQYDGEIAYCDREVGRLLDTVDHLGIAEDTVVILYADHGEVLLEHNGYFDHHGLYEANLWVPLIIRYPGVLTEGTRVSQMCQQIDLYPTILNLCGVEVPEHVDGRDLLPLTKDPGLQYYDEIYLSEATWGVKRGVRTTRWKYIRSYEQDFHGAPLEELYDLEADPEEQANVRQIYLEVAEELSVKLDQWLERVLKRHGRSEDPVKEYGQSLHWIGSGDPLQFRRLAAAAKEPAKTEE